MMEYNQDMTVYSFAYFFSYQ